jgi:hypothetical protein
MAGGGHGGGGGGAHATGPNGHGSDALLGQVFVAAMIAVPVLGAYTLLKPHGAEIWTVVCWGIPMAGALMSWHLMMYFTNWDKSQKDPVGVVSMALGIFFALCFIYCVLWLMVTIWRDAGDVIMSLPDDIDENTQFIDEMFE